MTNVVPALAVWLPATAQRRALYRAKELGRNRLEALAQPFGSRG